MAKTNAQRQRDKHARQAQRGTTRCTLTLSMKSITLLRSLARKHGKTQGEVIEAGLLAFSAMASGSLKLNAAPAPQQPVTSRDRASGEATLAAEQKSPPDSLKTVSSEGSEKPSWWQANADQLLASSRGE